MEEHKLSPTLQSVLNELSQASEVSSWELVKEILARHREYGEGHAREVASGPIPETLKMKPAQEWLVQVETLFDHTLVPSLHGRLVILGLCRLDTTLARHLRGFVTALEKEISEDFDSLLLPEHAGNKRYKHDFLVTLQNRGKLKSDAGTPRKNGFVYTVTGGPGLQSLEQLCFRQHYNNCLTARYILHGDSTINNFIQTLVADLHVMIKGDNETVGTLLPEETVKRETPPSGGWAQLAIKSAPALETISENTPNTLILEKLFANWHDYLKTGDRLVLFIEWRSVPKSATIDKMEFEDFIKQLDTLPERIGIVLSGLPANIVQQMPGSTLELPPDLALRHALPLANDIPDGPDRLNINDEVGALAEAIALKDMNPPVVVGILGGWGSGKSFVLHLLEERLNDIRCEKIETGDEDHFPFVGHPYVIRFDAWTFAKSDLWASLMQTILAELDRQLTLEKTLSKNLKLDLRDSNEIWRLLGRFSDTQRKRLANTELGREALDMVAKLQTENASGKLWEELNKLHENAINKLKTQEQELREKQAEATRAQREFENTIDLEIAADARQVAWSPVWRQVSKLVQDKFTETDAPTYEELVGAISLPKKYWLGLQNFSLPVATFALIALGGGIALDVLTPVTDFIGTSAGAFVVAMSPLLKAYDWLQANHKEYDEHLEQAMKTRIVSRDQRIKEALAHATENTKAATIVKLKKEIEAKSKSVQQLREHIGISHHASLEDFIKERLESGFYEKRLGLLHHIQRDIDELSETLLPSRVQGTMDSKALTELFPRGTPRLILLIDDLDRCPPHKVVEVFEAAQLLVKTQLFVVVIAMDVRYVTRALESEYKGVLVRNGEPSGLDYIEKIIQIPYRVRTASASAISGFLHHQMNFTDITIDKVTEPNSQKHEEQGDQANESKGEVVSKTEKDNIDERHAFPPPHSRTELSVLPTDILEFTTDEHTLISDCCSAIDVSPRAMKRLVNVFKLLKIIWYRDGLADGPEPEVKQAMLSLLVLAARYPEVVRQLFAAMEAAYRGPSSPGGEILADFLIAECSKRSVTAIYPPDWESVSAVLQDKQFFPDKLTFSELEETNLHLVSSFSFVGETDSEREATLKRGYYQRNDKPSAPETDNSKDISLNSASRNTTSKEDVTEEEINNEKE